MAYYRDVREYLNALEAAGKLVRIKQPINKDTEMHPLVRLQYRGLPEEQRRAFLFEKVIDIKGRTFEDSGGGGLLRRQLRHLCTRYAMQEGGNLRQVGSGAIASCGTGGSSIWAVPGAGYFRGRIKAARDGPRRIGLFCERELYHDAQEPGVCCISKSVSTQREQQNPWRRPRRAAARR